jgi:RNA polymerase sigma-70 factor, ECF subfamily
MLTTAIEMAFPSFDTREPRDDKIRDLIRDAKRGRTAAFERLILLHEKAVLRFAQRLLLNREAARDAAQDVFLRLYRKLQSIDEGRDLWPWLYRTTSNVCFDMLRKARNDLSLDLVAEPEVFSHNPEDKARLAQQQRLILEGLRELSPRERQAIVLRDLDGYPTSEVAVLLGSSETTVRSQISTGRVKLKNFLMARMGGQA